MKRTIIRNEMRQKLMDNAMQLVVEEGFSNLTTKKVAQASGLAEVYIYRYFESKTDLLEQCFVDAEKKLGGKIQEILVRKLETDLEKHAKKAWYDFWEYLMKQRTLVIYCTRFYNSSFYTDEMRQISREGFLQLLDEVSAEKKGWHIRDNMYSKKELTIQYVINVTADYAVKLMQGEIENTDEMVEFIYHRIVPSVLDEIQINYSE